MQVPWSGMGLTEAYDTRPMRVIHALDTLDPADGGPPQVAIRQASALAALGVEVSLLHCTPDPSRREAIGAMIAQVPGHERVRIVELPRSAIWRIPGRIALRHLPCLHGADWVHLHQVWHPMVRGVARAARSLGIPYVIRPAGSLSQWMLAQKALKKRLGLAIGYRRMVRGATFLQALNRDEADQIAHFRPGVPVEIVPNGIFPQELADMPPRGSFVQHCPAVAGRRFVVAVGRLHYSKGFDVLLEAFIRLAPRHPDLDLVIIGPDSGMGPALVRRAEQAGLGPRLHLPGAIYGKAKFAALVDAECFCLPSHHEAFSNAIVEALACGLPCVISRGAHFPEVAGAGAGSIVDIDAAQVEAAIDPFLTDASRHRDAAMKARALAHSYLWPEIGARLRDLYIRYG